MLTKLEIIEETIKHYSKRKRAARYSSCLYYYRGAMCAVGRCMINPKEAEKVYRGGSISDLINRINETNPDIVVDDLLLEQYRGHEIEFWEELQILHDRSSYWNNKKLSAEGLEYVEYLKNEYVGETNTNQ
jgi:hypothetical protein